MLYVMFHLGDWSTWTRLYSFLEKGVLIDLLVMYFSTESAINPSLFERITRRYTDEEMMAFNFVIEDFFYLGEDGLYHNDACDEVIAKSKEKSEKARKSIQARWSKKTDEQRSKYERNTDEILTNNHKPLTNNQVVSSTPNVNAEVIDGGIAEQDPDVKEGLFNDEPPVPTQRKAVATCPYEKIKALYGEVLPELTQPVMLSSARKSAMKARWQDVFNEEKITTEEEGLNCFRNFFGLVRQSKFLMGRTSKFKATLDWLMKQENFLKVCEGKYRS